MNVYLSAAGLGLLGLTAMAALGLAHGHSPGRALHGSGTHSSGAHGQGGHTPQALGHRHGHAPLRAHGPRSGSHAQDARSGEAGASLLPSLMVLASPRVWLSLLLGFGLCGLLLTAISLTAALPGMVLLALAGAGAVAFETLLVQPYWNVLMTFQSRPAQSLASSVQSRAVAVTDFDPSGSGLVSLEFEGEVRQLLATLEGWEQEKGLRVRRGDPLLIQSVDEARNRCTVSTLSN